MSINALEDQRLKTEILAQLENGASLTSLYNILSLAANGREDESDEEVRSDWEVDQTTFEMNVEEAVFALRAMGIDHNHRVGNLNSLLRKAENFEDISGLNVYYYFSEEMDDFIVHGQTSKLGFVPNLIDENGEEVIEDDSSIDNEEEQADLDSEPAVREVVYRLIDRTEFLMERAEILRGLTSISLRITEQILTLENMQDEIEASQDITGARTVYYYDPEGHNFGYKTIRKKEAGFFVPVKETTDKE